MQDLKVTLFQADIIWEDAEANRKYIEEKCFSLPSTSDVDLIVLPEMFNSGFTMHGREVAEKPGGPTSQWLMDWADKLNCAIAGSIVIEQSGLYFNRLLWAEPGRILKSYDKRHLFAMANEHKVYAPGKHKLVVEWRGWRIMPLVCFDLRFPVFFRNVEPYYDVAIVVANWPEARALHWNSLLPARAIENQCFVIGVNRIGIDGADISYTGDSKVISPHGTVLLDMKDEQAPANCILRKDEIELTRRHMPFLRDADRFWID